jgi:hypothetical protein
VGADGSRLSGSELPEPEFGTSLDEAVLRAIQQAVPDDFSSEDSIEVRYTYGDEYRPSGHTMVLDGVDVDEGFVKWNWAGYPGPDEISIHYDHEADVPAGTLVTDFCWKSQMHFRERLPADLANALAPCRTPADVARWWLTEELSEHLADIIADSEYHRVTINLVREVSVADSRTKQRRPGRTEEGESPCRAVERSDYSEDLAVLFDIAGDGGQANPAAPSG